MDQYTMNSRWNFAKIMNFLQNWFKISLVSIYRKFHFVHPKPYRFALNYRWFDCWSPLFTEINGQAAVVRVFSLSHKLSSCKVNSTLANLKHCGLFIKHRPVTKNCVKNGNNASRACHAQSSKTIKRNADKARLYCANNANTKSGFNRLPKWKLVKAATTISNWNN